MSPQLWVVFLAGVATLTLAQEKTLVDRVYDSLDRVLDFAQENHEDLNLDALYGIVLGQVNLQLILEEELGEGDRLRVKHLKRKADEIFHLVKPELHGDDPKVNAFLKNMIVPTRWRRDVVFETGGIDVDFEPAIWNFNIDTYDGFLTYLISSNMSESESDKCFLEVFESGPYLMHHNCTVSDECMKLMIDNQYYDPAYGITHRLLYLQTARSQNCQLDADMYRNKVRSYCSYIFWELKQNSNFWFIDMLDDLLLEQITLCGIEGYEEFLQRRLMEHILDIQDEHGCFTVRSPQLPGNIQKRAANTIKYGCIDHTTGLGASTLSLFLLYLFKNSEAF